MKCQRGYDGDTCEWCVAGVPKEPPFVTGSVGLGLLLCDIRFWFGAAMLLFVGVPLILWAGWGEVRYVLDGEKVNARVSAITEINPPRDPRAVIKYYFEDPELGMRIEEDVLSDWRFKPGDTVEIIYLPGVAERSRIVGNSEFFRVVRYMALLIMALVALCAATAIYEKIKKRRSLTA